MISAKKIAAGLWTALLSAGLLAGTAFASGGYVPDPNVTPIEQTDVAQAGDGCVMLGLPGHYVSDPQAALDRINEIRREACQEGVLNPETNMPLTPDDYVPIRWSSDLEYIARIRAAESAITIGHKRTNGDGPFDMRSLNGEQSWGEVLAWNWSESMTAGIDQWYGEKSDWINQTPNAVTGHYTQMIDPTNLYVGLGTFCSDNVPYYNTTAGEFSYKSGLDETFLDMIGECIQLLEVQTSGFSGTPEIVGDLTGVVGEEDALVLVTDVNFGRASEDLLVMDDISWSSDGSQVADVSSSGIVSAAGCGETVIHAQAPGNLSAQVTYTVPHLEETIAARAATCSTKGLTEGKRCQVCGEVLISQEETPEDPNNHEGEIVVQGRKAAACESKGYTGDKICQACQAVVEPGEDIPPTGHDWQSPSYTWSSDLKNVTAARVCKNDPAHKETETAVVTIKKTPASCEADGSVTYTAEFENAAFETQTKEDTIPATGHNWGAPTYTWSDDNSTVTATRICENDSSHKETETVASVEEWSWEAQCETEGETKYTASFDNAAFKTQEKTVTYPAVGPHTISIECDWNTFAPKVEGHAWCTKTMDYEIFEKADTTSEVIKDPTCEEEGIRRYTAKFKNPYLGTQTRDVPINPIGHEWGPISYEWSSDNRSVTATRICNIDNAHIETETVRTQQDTSDEDSIIYIAEFKNEKLERQTLTLPRQDIENCTITISPKTMTFTGQELKPRITVMDQDKMLSEGKDFTVDYLGNETPGRPLITIEGIGLYKGIYTDSFDIVPASIAKAAVSGISNKYYTGKAIKQAPVVKLGSVTLKSGTDYTVSYKNNTNPGKATVTITGKGNYAGTINKTFSINTAKPAISAVTNVNGGVRITWGKVTGASKYRVFRKVYNDSTKKWSAWANLANTTAVNYTDAKVANGRTYCYTVRCMNSSGAFVSTYDTAGKSITYVLRPTISSLTSPKTKQMLVRWGRNAAATGYVIQYSTSSKFASGNKAVTVKGAANVSRTISSLMAKKRYYVRVRTFKTVGKKNHYSAWSAVKNVVTK